MFIQQDKSLPPPPEELERQEEILSRAATTFQRNEAYDWFVKEIREGTMASLVEKGKKADLIIEDEIDEEDPEVKPKRNRVDLILAAARRKNEEEN